MPEVHRLRVNAIFAILKSINTPHQDHAFARAIQESGHLRAQLTRLLSNVEQTCREVCDRRNAPFPSMSWARTTVYLLRIIHLAACESVTVVEAIQDVHCEFMSLVIRFSTIGSGTTWPWTELQRWRTRFEENLRAGYSAV